MYKRITGGLGVWRFGSPQWALQFVKCEKRSWLKQFWRWHAHLYHTSNWQPTKSTKANWLPSSKPVVLLDPYCNSPQINHDPWKKTNTRCCKSNSAKKFGIQQEWHWEGDFLLSQKVAAREFTKVILIHLLRGVMRESGINTKIKQKILLRCLTTREVVNVE